MLLCERVGLLKTETIRPVMDRCGEVGKMLRALIRSLQDKAGV